MNKITIIGLLAFLVFCAGDPPKEDTLKVKKSVQMEQVMKFQMLKLDSILIIKQDTIIHNERP